MEFNPHSKLHRLLAKWLIRFGWVKHTPADLQEINQAIKPFLPVDFAIKIPSGSGELSLLDVELSIDGNFDRVIADTLCFFQVNVAGSTIYKAHIQVILSGIFVYDKAQKTIIPDEVKVESSKLITDRGSMIKDTRSLIIDLLPEPIKTVFISTLVTSDAILKTIGVNDLVRYLSIYLGGSKQRILDYHHTEIENKILAYIESGELTYALDETDFEEQLFAEYGQKVSISDGQLLFVFHDS